MISVDVKHRVYLLTYLHAEGPKTEKAREPTAESLLESGGWEYQKQSGEYECVCVCVWGGGGGGLWGVFAGLGTSA